MAGPHSVALPVLPGMEASKLSSHCHGLATEGSFTSQNYIMRSEQ
jgi:hypothetical protein